MHNPEFVQGCKTRLLQMKADLLNRLSMRIDMTIEEKASGDEADQAMAQRAETIFSLHQERTRHQLFEVEQALHRIQVGTYGICEETEEPIEKERLLALPATRLSIEGAEIREALSKRFAQSS